MPRRMTRVLTGAVVVTTLGLAGCTATHPGASPTASTSPSSPAPQNPSLQSVPLVALPGVAAGAATGRFLSVPPGWRAEIWADVPHASAMVWTPAGDLLVSSPDTGKVVRLHPGAPDAQAPRMTDLMVGLDRPFGLAISQANDRTTVVVGTASEIVALELSGGAVSAKRILVSGLPRDGLNAARSVTVSADGQQVYYGIGTATDRDPAERTADRRGVIQRVPLAGGRPQTVAVGVRQAGGLDLAPDGTLYAAVAGVQDPVFPYHSPIDGHADGFGMTGTSWAVDQPSDQITPVRDGQDLGWPWCMPDSGGPGTDLSLQVAIKQVPDPSTNPGQRHLDCASLGPTEAGLPAHSEPTALRFLFDTAISSTMVDGALAVAHGSSAPAVPRAPGVYYLGWDADAHRLTTPELLVGGFQNPNGSRWGRSVDAAPDPEGRLFVSDSLAGLVYRLTPPAQ